MRVGISIQTVMANLPWNPPGSQVPKVLRRTPPKGQDQRCPDARLDTLGREFYAARSRISRDVRSRILLVLGGRKRRVGSRLCSLYFCIGDAFSASGLRLPFRAVGCDRSQQRVLIVVATARYDPPLLVEAADLAEGQRHLAPSRPHRSERPAVGAFDGELGDDNVSRVGMLGIGDAAVLEGLGPSLHPFLNFSRVLSVIARA